MKVRNRNFKKQSSKENFWPSFADVMSTFALVMLFLVMIVFIRNILFSLDLKGEQDKLAAAQNELAAMEADLAETEADLDTKEQELFDKQENLIILGEKLQSLLNELTSTQANLNEKEEILAVRETELEETKIQLEQTQTEIDAQQQILALLSEEIANTNEELENQKLIIATTTEELENMRTKLQDIALLRASIFEKVKVSIEEAFGSSVNDKGEPLVTIGDNANIIINESLVFDLGSPAIKEEGKPLLEQLSIAFESILDDEETRNVIDSIIIEGHADSLGDVDDNLALSQNRANNVLEYIISSNPGFYEKYGKYITSCGYSEFRPIGEYEEEKADAKNRRIEFAIKVKDANVKEVIENYLAELQDLENN